MMKKTLLLSILCLSCVAMMCAQSASAQEAYACADYNYTSNYATLTFYYDNDRSSRLGATFELNAGEYFPGWVTSGFSSYVKYVVFDPSLRGLQETRVATREEIRVLGFPSRRGLTPRGSLECNPEIPAFPGEEY